MDDVRAVDGGDCRGHFEPVATGEGHSRQASDGDRRLLENGDDRLLARTADVLAHQQLYLQYAVSVLRVSALRRWRSSGGEHHQVPAEAGQFERLQRVVLVGRARAPQPRFPQRRVRLVEAGGKSNGGSTVGVVWPSTRESRLRGVSCSRL